MAELATPNVFARECRRTVDLHYCLTLLLAAALVPAFRLARLPLRFAWANYFKMYCFTLFGQSIILAVVLYIVGVPFVQSIGPFLQRYSRQKARFLFVLPAIPILILASGVTSGLLLLVTAIFMLEVKDRIEECRQPVAKLLLDFLLPGAYLFAGIVLMLAFNDVVASFRYDGNADLVLKRWDAVLLGGRSVSDFAHAFTGRWPGTVPWMEVIYFAMLPQIGACLAILVFTEGRRRGLQFVGAIITAYYLALVLFYLWPAIGPSASCANHFARFPDSAVKSIQQFVLASVTSLHAGQSLRIIGNDYYIAFPCMHLVQPMIVLWFLKRQRRIRLVLLAFDLLMIPCILLLEQHYLVDLIAAFPVAALAIVISGIEIPTWSSGDAGNGLLQPGFQASPNRSS